MLTDAVTVEVTTMVIALEVAGLPITQLAFDVRTQLTTSLLFSVADVKDEEFVPAFVPLTFHWYEGVVPPLVGVAVKVTDVP